MVPLLATVQDILDCPVPRKYQQLRGFLSMCGYFSGFFVVAKLVVSYVELAVPTLMFSSFNSKLNYFAVETANPALALVLPWEQGAWESMGNGRTFF